MEVNHEKSEGKESSGVNWIYAAYKIVHTFDVLLSPIMSSEWSVICCTCCIALSSTVKNEDRKRPKY